MVGRTLADTAVEAQASHMQSKGKAQTVFLSSLAAIAIVFGLPAVSSALAAVDMHKKRRIQRMVEATKVLVKLIHDTPPGEESEYELEKDAHKKLFKRVGWKTIEKLVEVARETLDSKNFVVKYASPTRTITVRHIKTKKKERDLREYLRSKLSPLFERAGFFKGDIQHGKNMGVL